MSFSSIVWAYFTEQLFNVHKELFKQLGSGCGSVSKAVAYDTRDLRFESNHWLILFTIDFIRSCAVVQTKKKKKRPELSIKNNYHLFVFNFSEAKFTDICWELFLLLQYEHVLFQIRLAVFQFQLAEGRANGQQNVFQRCRDVWSSDVYTKNTCTIYAF